MIPHLFCNAPDTMDRRAGIQNNHTVSDSPERLLRSIIIYCDFAVVQKFSDNFFKDISATALLYGHSLWIKECSARIVFSSSSIVWF